MALPNGHKTNFDVLTHAFASGRVVLAECANKQTGEPVAIVCAINQGDGDNVNLVPFAEMLAGDPFEYLNPPAPASSFELDQLQELAANSYRRAVISIEDLDTMLFSSIRYAMGRMTYVVSDTAEIVRAYWKYLSKPRREQIITELRNELERAARENRLIGMEMDHEVWQKLYDDLLKEFLA